MSELAQSMLYSRSLPNGVPKSGFDLTFEKIKHDLQNVAMREMVLTVACPRSRFIHSIQHGVHHTIDVVRTLGSEIFGRSNAEIPSYVVVSEDREGS